MQQIRRNDRPRCVWLSWTCRIIFKTDYIQRHNKAAVYFVYVRRQCQHYNIQVPGKWYEHEPATATGNEEATLLWDMQIHTDREIHVVANKPDIAMKDQKNKTCKLIDMVVP